MKYIISGTVSLMGHIVVLLKCFIILGFNLKPFDSNKDVKPCHIINIK